MQSNELRQKITSAWPSVGLIVPNNQFPVARVLDLALAAEEAGFDGLWFSERLWPAPDGGSCWPILASIGCRTRLIKLGAGIARCKAAGGPAVIASSVAALAAFQPGRVFLAVGAYAGCVERVIRAVRRLRGKTDVMPVYLAGTTTHSAELAGRYGDGWITNATSLARVPGAQAFRAGASSGNRDPDTLPVLVQLDVVIGGAAELAEAAELKERTLVGFAELLNEPQAFQAGQFLVRYDPFRGWALGVQPAAHVQAICRLVIAGATHVYICSGQSDLRRVIDFYGGRVLDLLRGGSD